MVDFNNISKDLQGRIEKIMAGDGKDTKKIDSRNEYNQLAALLSGTDKKKQDKVSGTEKVFVENLMTDYEEEFMVRANVKERVLEIIKFGNSNKADDNAELKELKNFKKTNDLTKEEKNWIQKVINGRIVKTETNTGKEILPDSPEEKEQDTLTGYTNFNPDKTEMKKNKTTPEEDSHKNPPTGEPADKPNKIPEDKHKNPPKDYPNDMPNKMPEHEHKNHPKDYPDDMPNKIPEEDHKNKSPEIPETKPENEPVNPPTETVPTEPSKPLPKEENKGLTPVEISAARNNGEGVADRLFGYTTNTEQWTIQDIVENEIDSGNVIEFFRGYEERLAERTELNIADYVISTVNYGHRLAKENKDSFFEQMRTEWDFPEKQELMHKVAGDLQEYLADKYGADSKVAKEVAVILLERIFDQKDTEKLDKIAKEELTK